MMAVRDLPLLSIRTICRRFAILSNVVISIALGDASFVHATPVDFGQDILPILREKCFFCHSTDLKKPKGELRLDSRERMESFRSDLPLITPGKPEQSNLYLRVSLPHDDGELMPPPGEKTPLTKSQTEQIRTWILQGAYFGDWTQAAKLTATTQLADADIPTTTAEAVLAVEALLEAGRLRAGVKSTGSISDEVFLRRIYLDIAGRIPTLDEAESFLAELQPNKRSQLIDRLLNSEAHVSHFYNYWADVFRIRESRWGDTAIEAFQEWVKTAIRENRPWDQMVATILNATGNCLDDPAVGYWYRDYQMPLDNLAYTTQILLATQLDCAVCHNHPFDKWSQYQFFELAAYLNEPQYIGHLPGWVTRDDLLLGVPRLKQILVEVDGKSVLKWVETGPKDPAAEKRRRTTYHEMLKTVTVDDLRNSKRAESIGYEFKEYVQNWGRRQVALESERRNSGFYETEAEGERNYAAARMVEAFNQVFDFRIVRQGREQAQLPDNYQYADAKPSAWVNPSVPFGKLPLRKPGQPIHSVFAEWMTSQENPKFTKTIANRLFAYVYRIGLYPEHDNIRDDAVSSHPELTALLEGLMRRNRYDMREFLRVLYNTPTYQSASVLPQSSNDPLAAGPKWPWSYEGAVLRRLSAEQFWDSIVTLALPQPDLRKRYFRYRDVDRWKTLTDLKPEALLEQGRSIIEEEHQLRLLEATPSQPARYSHKAPALHPAVIYRGYSEELARASELRQPTNSDHFLRMFGASDREMIENSNRSTTVPQTLALMNRLVDGYVLSGPSIKHGYPGSPVSRILNRDLPASQKVAALYLTILSRLPTTEEVDLTEDIKNTEDWQDFVWSLVNSEEFRFLQ